MVLIKGSVPSGAQHWALFDLDWTLIRPLKGTLFRNNTGWMWLPGRKEILLQLERNGFRIGIITNQKPWVQQTIQSIDQRLTEVYTDLRTTLAQEPLILAGLNEPQYRKPALGWLSVISLAPGSFFVGDAAGRPDDFSDSDIRFAQNAGIPFYTPEQIFPSTTIPPELYTIPKVFVLLVGVQGSGKTTFAQQLSSNGWVVVSSDTYASNKSRIQAALRGALSTGRKVVFDATNPTMAGRMEYIALGESFGYPVAIVHLLNGGEGRNKLRERPVPKVAMSTYWSRYEEPTPITDHVPVYELL
jgi:bifunctional polynucleotide phosphatase/kinase